MSTDLLAATVRRPSQADVAAFLNRHLDVRGVGVLPEDRPSLLNFEGVETGEPLCTVDGPFAFETSGLAERSGELPAPVAWVLEISIPAAASGPLGMMGFMLAQHLVQVCDGVIYDPQRGAVVWPTEPHQR